MALPRFSFDDAQLNADVWSLFLQETAKRGVLIRRGGLLFVTYSHGDADIEATLAAVDEALGVIADGLAEDKLADLLQVKDVEEGFRRF